MNNLKLQLERLSELLSKDSYSEETLRRIVIRRNQLLHKPIPKSKVVKSEKCENKCEVLSNSTRIPLRFRAYHSGPASQLGLRSNEKGIFEGYCLTRHVFFSLDLEDLIRNYLLPENCNDRIIYVTELRKVKNARVQISYESEILWNDRIRTLAQCYQDPEYMDRLLREYKWTSDYKFIKPFIGKTKRALKKEIIKKINEWISEYTIPFRLENLEQYREQNWNYILIPQPLRVKV